MEFAFYQAADCFGPGGFRIRLACDPRVKFGKGLGLQPNTDQRARLFGATYSFRDNTS